jgi:hypothetical protein
MSKEDELVETIKVLRQEVEVLTTRLRPGGTGYLHTAIDVINGRIDELIGKAVAPYFEKEDVNDGYKEHTEAMEQARLREIQDSAAGKKPNAVRDAYLHSSKVKDEVEHSPCYYDTERNKAPKNEPSMKDKHGHAVHTIL